MTLTMDKRERIAEALGWEMVINFMSPSVLIGVPPDKGISREIPDWTHDPGTALALCKKIALDKGYELRIKPGNGYLSTRAEFWTSPSIGDQVLVCGAWSHASIPQKSDEWDTADALSNIALIILEEQNE